MKKLVLFMIFGLFISGRAFLMEPESRSGQSLLEILGIDVRDIRIEVRDEFGNLVLSSEHPNGVGQYAYQGEEGAED